jgi:Tetratricopeptide repeat
MTSERMHLEVHRVGTPCGVAAQMRKSSKDDRSSFFPIPSLRFGIASIVSSAALLLGGCASSPPPSAEPAPAVVSLEEWLVRGDAARKEGLQEAARSAYRDGAKAYPTEKQPWLRLADSYFQSGDYGNAVLAAQEAVQRDPKDNAAHSLLAVSGLRITAGSLSALREQSGYPVGSREEALDVTRRLREALSDPTLLAPVVAEPPAPPRKARPAVKPPTAAATPAATAMTASPAAKPSPATGPAPTPTPAPSATASVKPAVRATASAPAQAAAPKPAGNPLDKLK